MSPNVDRMCPTVVAEPHLPSVQLAAMTHSACCRLGLVPELLGGQSGAAVGLYLSGVSSQTRCFVTGFLGLRLICVVIFSPSSQGRYHFGVILAG